MELYHNLSLFPRPPPPCVPANPTGLFGITVLVNFPLCAFTFMQMSQKKKMRVLSYSMYMYIYLYINEDVHMWFYVHLYIPMYIYISQW